MCCQLCEGRKGPIVARGTTGCQGDTASHMRRGDHLIKVMMSQQTTKSNTIIVPMTTALVYTRCIATYRRRSND